jgi:hypothetical protein
MKPTPILPRSECGCLIPVALAMCRLLPNLSTGQDLETVKKKVRTQFPSVRQLSTSELAAWSRQTNRPPPVLLDARTPAEFSKPFARRAPRGPEDAAD